MTQQPVAAALSNGRPPVQSVLVLVPTYNERDNLPGIVARVRAVVPGADLLVLDDASPDGTGEVADELAARDPAVHVLHRDAKHGLGAAYLAGFAWGTDRGYDALVEMDADGSHQPEQLPALLAALDGADLVLGSRWVPGGAVVNWPRRREALSRGASIYTRLLLGVPIGDVTGGFRAYRASTLRAIDLEHVASQGYCFQVDLLWRTLRAGLVVLEVPITFIERQVGDSKMSGNIIRESLQRITTWGLQYRAGQLGELVRGRREPTWHRLDTPTVKRGARR